MLIHTVICFWIVFGVEGSQFRDWGILGRSEVWRWSQITWSCPEDIEDGKVTSVMATWQCHRGET